MMLSKRAWECASGDSMQLTRSDAVVSKMIRFLSLADVGICE